MKTHDQQTKFNQQVEVIKELDQHNERFHRIYSEYQFLTEELWNLESTSMVNVSDDFLQSCRLQQLYLEEEIEDWISHYPQT